MWVVAAEAEERPEASRAVDDDAERGERGRDHGAGERRAPREPAPGGDDQRDRNRGNEAYDAGRRSAEDEADQPADDRDPGRDAQPVAYAPQQGHDAEAEDHAGEGGEVLRAEQRRLAVPLSPSSRDVPAAPLQHADDGRDDRPADEGAEREQRVRAAPDEQGDRGREQRVLGELARGDEMRMPWVRARGQQRVEDGGADPEEERDARRPHGDSGAKGGETAANDGGRRAERGEEDERVGELEGRRPERDRRLEPHVQEDDGQRQREDGRARGDVAREHEQLSSRHGCGGGAHEASVV